MAFRNLVTTGQGPLPPRCLPSYAYHTGSCVERRGSASSVQTLVSLIWRLWFDRQYKGLAKRLVGIGEILEKKDETRFASEFLASGGLDTYCFILCDPFNPLRAMEVNMSYSMISPDGRRGRRRANELILAVYREIMLQLTDLLADQSDLGWVIYDRYPGLLYRLIEFLEDSVMWVPAAGLLEHILACVGPVLEISKTPSLIQVLRRAQPTVLAALCRFLALLILPGLAQGQNPILARRLHYPETVVVLRQVQRVVDSNVLWLIGEKGLVSALISLCELRPNGIRVQQGGRSMMMLPPQTTWVGEEGRRVGDVRRGSDRADSGLFEDDEYPWEDVMEDNEPWSENGAQEESGDLRSGEVEDNLFLDVSTLRRSAGVERWLEMRQPQISTASFTLPVSPTGSAADQLVQLLAENEQVGTFSASGERSLQYARTAVRDDTTNAVPNTNRTVPVVASPQRPPSVPVAPAQGNPQGGSGDDRGIMSAGLLASLLGTGGSPDDGDPLVILNRIASSYYEPDELSRWVQWALDRDFLEQHGMEEGLKPTLDVRWWVGVSDTRQRWRLRDPSLIPERDDNRHVFVCRAINRITVPDSRTPSLEEYKAANEKLATYLFQPSHNVNNLDLGDMMCTQRIFESQSEVLYLLSMFLSTFYFSDSWETLRDCRWIPRSVSIFKIAFGLDPSLPAFVDVAPPVQVPAKLRVLPRFLPPLSPADRGEEVGVLQDGSPRYPATWRVVPLLKLIGDVSILYLRDPGQISEEEMDDHQHGPDTMRKMELLHGLHEYWNAQDRWEQEMVVEDAEVVASARVNAEAMAHVTHEDKEDSCVRGSLYQTLESYLRTFLFREADRDAPDSPQTKLGSIILTDLLERIYNGTRVLGLSGSMAPSRLLSNLYQILGELLRYHAGNLRILCSYVVGERDMSHLNETVSNTNRRNALVLSLAHEEVEEILRRPPLEREEQEPFGSVLLRRFFTCGVEAHPLLRSLLFSLTPGLRSTGNYLTKPVKTSVDDVRLAPTLPGIGRTSDIISGDAVRISYVIRVSRKYTKEISLAPRQGPRRGELLMELVFKLASTPHRQAPEQRPFPCLMTSDEDLLLLRSDYPLPEVGPPPRLRAPLFGCRGENSATAPASLARHTESPSAPSGEASDTPHIRSASAMDPYHAAVTAEDAARLKGLAPLAQLLLDEPHKLIFSSLCGLNVEAMEDNSHLSVVTTVLLLFLRVGAVGSSRESAAAAEANIRDVLERMRSFAAHGYNLWVREERVAWAKRRKTQSEEMPITSEGGKHVCTCGGRDVPKAGGVGDRRLNADVTAYRAPDSETTREENTAARRNDFLPNELPCRCASFTAYGCCDPSHEGIVYQHEFGGCFYRSFFRLLCLWVGYYASCQRYVETIYFSTEIAFGEYKTMAFFLMRILPDFFMPHFFPSQRLGSIDERRGMTSDTSV